MISSYYFCARGQCVADKKKCMCSKVCWTINLPQKVPVIIIWEGESVHVFIGDVDLGCQGSLPNFSVCLVVNISIHLFIVLTLPVLLLYWRMWNLRVKKDGLLALLSTMMKGLFLLAKCFLFSRLKLLHANYRLGEMLSSNWFSSTVLHHFQPWCLCKHISTVAANLRHTGYSIWTLKGDGYL